MKKTVVFVAAHADDMEVLAGGTMAKLIDQGYKFVYVMATNNMDGIDDKGPYECMKIRKREACEAAAVLGVKPIFLDFKNITVWNINRRYFLGQGDWEFEKSLPGNEIIVIVPKIKTCVTRLTKILVAEEPEYVFSLSYVDFNPEHYATANLTYNAFHLAAKTVELGTLFAARWGEGAFTPHAFDVIVDITEYINKKTEAISKFVSQFGPGIKDIEKNRDRFVGWFSGVGGLAAESPPRYREAFATIANARLGIPRTPWMAEGSGRLRMPTLPAK